MKSSTFHWAVWGGGSRGGVGEECSLKGQIQEAKDVLGCGAARAQKGPEWEGQEFQTAWDHPLAGLPAEALVRSGSSFVLLTVDRGVENFKRGASKSFSLTVLSTSHMWLVKFKLIKIK